jgi:dTDP-4-dehydrorhamnose reductase
MKFSASCTKVTNKIHISKTCRVLVTGVTSIHGWPIFSTLQKLLPPPVLLGITPPKTEIPMAHNVTSLCITDKKTLESIKHAFKPTHVIHCAGVCDLDVCEERPKWANAMNVHGTRNIADVFGDDIPIIYMSTDLVFSGNNPPPDGYSETDRPDPISVAGKTFAEAEKYILKRPNCCIVRLGLPLGDSINGNKGAVDWIESRFKRRLPVTLFFDEYRSCVSCEAIGSIAVAILNLKLKGLFHFGGEKGWSLYEIGKYVLRKGNYPSGLLNGIMRNQEKGGPPRIGDVSLNSTKMKDTIGRRLML